MKYPQHLAIILLSLALLLYDVLFSLALLLAPTLLHCFICKLDLERAQNFQALGFIGFWFWAWVGLWLFLY